MMLARCDKCCDVLDGIDDSIVIELSQEAQKETANEYKHLCEECFNEVNSDCMNLEISRRGNYYALIIKDSENK